MLVTLAAGSTAAAPVSLSTDSAGNISSVGALVIALANGKGSIQPGATIPALTGASAAIAAADTSPANYGRFNAPGGSGAGYGLIGGPLLNDAQAASFVLPAPRSVVETGPRGAANAAANNYYNYIAATNPNAYLNQLRAPDGFYAAYAGSGWQSRSQPDRRRMPDGQPNHRGGAAMGRQQVGYQSSVALCRGDPGG